MLLDARREELSARLRASLGTTPQSDAFAVRVLGETVVAALRPAFVSNGDSGVVSVRYGGFPAVAALGFRLGAPTWCRRTGRRRSSRGSPRCGSDRRVVPPHWPTTMSRS